MRYRPPRIDLVPELRWILRQGFASSPVTVAGRIDASLVDRFAETLELWPRLAARLPIGLIRRELGAAVAARAEATRTLVMAREMAHEVAFGMVAALAAELSTPVALLKGMALRRGGHVSPASRISGDIDVLVHRSSAEELQRRLQERGFEDSVAATDFHLPTITHPRWASIEIHWALPGVCLAGRPVGVEDLLQAELLLATDDPGDAFLPRRELLIAHSLSHGIAQHGGRPWAYPMMLMLADLIDLRFDSDLQPASLDMVRSLAVPSVSDDELQAARRLCGALREGGAVAGGELDPGAETLLFHALAGRLDPDYGEALKLTVFRPSAAGRRGIAAFVDTVWRTILPGEEALSARYGAAKPGMARAVRLSRHLLRLAAQLALSLYRSARLRFDRRLRSPSTDGRNG